MIELGRRGSVIVVVLLLTLAAMGLAHGALLMARGELAASRIRLRHLERRTLAEHALAQVLARPIGAELGEMPMWSERAVRDSSGAPSAEALLRRVTREVWSARGITPAGLRPAITSPAHLVWVMDPLERLLLTEGVVTVADGAPVVADGPVDVSRYTAVDPPLTAGSCDEVTPSSLGGRSVPPVAVLMPGELRPGIGLIPFDSALARTDGRLDPAGTPGPIEVAGTCIEGEPWNWGDPERPWRPCGDHLAVRAGEGPVLVDGGSGQGALIVDGDLTLTSGARFHGFVLVSGALRVTSGSALHGVAVAAGGLEVAGDSRIVGSACWAHRALSAAVASWSGWPVLLPGVGRLAP